MSHDIWLGWLDAYVDGSCTPEELEGIEDHLRNCSSCATDTLGRLQMKIATRAAAVRYTPSVEFRARIEKSLKVSRKPLWTIPWVRGAAAAAVALLLVVAGVSLWHRQSARSQAVAELLDVHVATTASTNPVDVTSTDQHNVKPWFQGKLPYTFNLPDLQSSPFKLQGGRLVYFRHNPGAQLVYELRKHQISVFILQDQPGVTPPGSGVSTAREKGFSTETWSQAGLRYIVVSDTAPIDLHALCELLRAAGSQ
jgi:anti-sigma factor RsiW